MVRVTQVTYHDGFTAMLEHHSIAACLPDVTSLDAAVKVYESFPGYRENAKRHGVIGFTFHVEDTNWPIAKAGGLPPMPAPGTESRSEMLDRKQNAEDSKQNAVAQIHPREDHGSVTDDDAELLKELQRLDDERSHAKAATTPLPLPPLPPPALRSAQARTTLTAAEEALFDGKPIQCAGCNQMFSAAEYEEVQGVCCYCDGGLYASATLPMPVNAAHERAPAQHHVRTAPTQFAASFPAQSHASQAPAGVPLEAPPRADAIGVGAAAIAQLLGAPLDAPAPTRGGEVPLTAPGFGTKSAVLEPNAGRVHFASAPPFAQHCPSRQRGTMPHVTCDFEDVERRATMHRMQSGRDCCDAEGYLYRDRDPKVLMDQHVKLLLDAFVASGHDHAMHPELRIPMRVYDVWRSLPMVAPWHTWTSHEETLSNYRAVLHGHCRDFYDSTSGTRLEYAMADTMPYPLAVLFYATSVVTSLPAAFYADGFMSVVSSLHHTSFGVQTPNFLCRTRTWVVGVAEPSEGKSPALAPILFALKQAMMTRKEKMTGHPPYHHQMDSGTTHKGALYDVLGTMKGHCLFVHTEAGAILPVKFAQNQGDWPQQSSIDIPTTFMEAANGGPVVWKTANEERRNTKKTAAAAKATVRGAVVEAPSVTRIDETNCVFLLVHQRNYTRRFWAQLEVNKQIGLTSRFSFSFGRRLQRMSRLDAAGFADKIFVPMLQYIFGIYIDQLGPKCTFAGESAQLKEWPMDENARMLYAHTRRMHRLLASQLPGATAFNTPLSKSDYMLPNYALEMEILLQITHHVCHGGEAVALRFCPVVSDTSFEIGMRYFAKRYMAGHGIIQRDVHRQAWLFSDVVEDAPDRLGTSALCKAMNLLREVPLHCISVGDVANSMIEFEQAMNADSTNQQNRVDAILAAFKLLREAGFGRIVRDRADTIWFQKRCWSHLPLEVQDAALGMHLPSNYFASEWSPISTIFPVVAPKAKRSATSSTAVHHPEIPPRRLRGSELEDVWEGEPLQLTTSETASTSVAPFTLGQATAAAQALSFDDDAERVTAATMPAAFSAKQEHAPQASARPPTPDVSMKLPAAASSLDHERLAVAAPTLPPREHLRPAGNSCQATVVSKRARTATSSGMEGTVVAAATPSPLARVSSERSVGGFSLAAAVHREPVPPQRVAATSKTRASERRSSNRQISCTVDVESDAVSRDELDAWLQQVMESCSALTCRIRTQTTVMTETAQGKRQVKRCCLHRKGCRMMWVAEADPVDAVSGRAVFKVKVPACCDMPDPIEPSTAATHQVLPTLANVAEMMQPSAEGISSMASGTRQRVEQQRLMELSEIDERRAGGGSSTAPAMREQTRFAAPQAAVVAAPTRLQTKESRAASRSVVTPATRCSSKHLFTAELLVDGEGPTRSQLDTWVKARMGECGALRHQKREVVSDLAAESRGGLSLERRCRHSFDCRARWKAYASPANVITHRSTIQMLRPSCCDTLPSADDAMRQHSALSIAAQMQQQAAEETMLASSERQTIPGATVVPDPPADGEEAAGTTAIRNVPVCQVTLTEALPLLLTNEWTLETFKQLAAELIPVKTLTLRARASRNNVMRRGYLPCRCKTACQAWWSVSFADPVEHRVINLAINSPQGHEQHLAEMSRRCAIWNTSTDPMATKLRLSQDTHHAEHAQQLGAPPVARVTEAAIDGGEVVTSATAGPRRRLRSSGFMSDAMHAMAETMLQTSGGQTTAKRIITAWVEQGLLPRDQRKSVCKPLIQTIRRSRSVGILPRSAWRQSTIDFITNMQATRSQPITAANPSRLSLIAQPIFNLEEKLLFVAFGCQRFLQAAFRIKDHGLMFAVDGKWGAISNNRCFATVGLVVPTLSRSHTAVARIKLRGFKVVRLQAQEFTTTFVPLVPAMVHSESNPHIAMLLNTLCTTYPETDKSPNSGVPSRALQLAKDYAKSLEAGRATFLPHSRPMGDWSHFSRQLASKAKSAGIGREQVSNVQQLCHRTRFIPTLELHNALWSCQFAYFDRRDWHRLRSNLCTDYFTEYSLESLKQMPVVRLLPGHERGTKFWMAHWFTGIFSAQPRSAGGSQCVEAYHRAWDHHIGKSSTAKQLGSAMVAYQALIDEMVASPLFQDDAPISLHNTSYDSRLFAANGLAPVGDVSGMDLWRFRANGNYVVVRSPTLPNSIYVVFNQTPMMQEQIRQCLKSNAALESRLKAHARRRSQLGLGVRVVETALPLTASDVRAIVAESWELHHPAAEAVDTAGASLFVQLLELTGDDLQRRLHQLGVLREPDAGGVNFERFDDIMKFEVA